MQRSFIPTFTVLVIPYCACSLVPLDGPTFTAEPHHFFHFLPTDVTEPPLDEHPFGPHVSHGILERQANGTELCNADSTYSFLCVRIARSLKKSLKRNPEK